MTSRETQKRAAALEALSYVNIDAIIGVGTGSTVAHFIDALDDAVIRPTAAVATSADTERRLHAIGIDTVPLEQTIAPLALYVDGADEIDDAGRAIKGGGGAHAREKRVAEASTVWVCIVDEGKLVQRLGLSAPVPLEVFSAALPDVTSAVAALGGTVVVRAGVLADSGNLIVDVHNLDLEYPTAMEDALESIDGVVACGIFSHRTADVILVGKDDGSVLTITPAV